MRIGFACQRFPQTEQLKVSTTTLSHMRKRPLVEAYAHLGALANRNALATLALIQSVAREPRPLHMVRIGSGLWPLSDHPEFRGYDRSVSRTILRRAGALARQHDIRLSFHPGQFVALGSDRAEAVQNAIDALEEHGEQAELLGARDINIHMWGRGGIRAFRENAGYLSDRVRSRLTVENDEFGVGSDSLLDANLDFPLVLDPHHHWINTGEWASRALMRLYAQTWPQHRRPKMHWSWPRNDYSERGWPALEGSRTAARSHNDLLPNLTANGFYLQAAYDIGFDIMVEAKMKDVARDQLYTQALEMDLYEGEQLCVTTSSVSVIATRVPSPVARHISNM